MIKVIAVLCSLSDPNVCHNHTLVSANMGDLPIPVCMQGSPELRDMLVDLVADHPNERLKTWLCEMGERISPPKTKI